MFFLCNERSDSRFADYLMQASFAVFIALLSCGGEPEEPQYFINIVGEPYGYDEEEGTARLGAILGTDAPPGHEFEIEFLWDEGTGEIPYVPIPEKFLEVEVGSRIGDNPEESEFTEPGIITGPGRVRYTLSSNVELFAARVKMREVRSEICRQYHIRFRLLGFEGFEKYKARLESGYRNRWWPNIREGAVDLEMTVGDERFVAEPGSIKEVEVDMGETARDIDIVAGTASKLATYVRCLKTSEGSFLFREFNDGVGEGRADLNARAIEGMVEEGIEAVEGFCYSWAYRHRDCMLTHAPEPSGTPRLPMAPEDIDFLQNTPHGVSIISFRINLDDVAVDK